MRAHGRVVALFSATAYLQDVPRNPYTQPSTAYYEVERWPAPFARPGYIRASNSGIFVESPDRIYLITRGEIRLPEQLPADFNGAIGSLPERRHQAEGRAARLHRRRQRERRDPRALEPARSSVCSRRARASPDQDQPVRSRAARVGRGRFRAADLQVHQRRQDGW